MPLALYGARAAGGSTRQRERAITEQASSELPTTAPTNWQASGALVRRSSLLCAAVKNVSFLWLSESALTGWSTVDSADFPSVGRHAASYWGNAHGRCSGSSYCKESRWHIAPQKSCRRSPFLPRRALHCGIQVQFMSKPKFSRSIGTAGAQSCQSPP